jgi:bifunctional non-homologous end joining protein LigD
VDKAPTGSEWLHKLKYDGYRTGACIASGCLRELKRGLEWTARFRPITRAVTALPVRTAYVDGQIAVVGKDAVTSSANLPRAAPPTNKPSNILVVAPMAQRCGRRSRSR